MGKQARLRAERRLERQHTKAFDQRFAGAPVAGEPLRILRSLHGAIQDHCHESGRRCWEYLLEIMALSSGWNTETAESRHLWDRFGEDSRLVEYAESWFHEVKHARENRLPFSEPLGELLHEVNGNNENLGQFLTPMSVVRTINAMNLAGLDDYPLHHSGMPTHRGLDPCCGTGRFMLDALVHNQNIMMHGVDLDVWMLRAAKINVRLLAPYTSLRLKDPADVMKPLRQARYAVEMMTRQLEGEDFEADPTSGELERLPHRVHDPGVIVVGGRAIFMQADSLVVDLDYAENWLCGGWAWTPRPWTSNLKMAGYHGSYDDWIADGRPTPDQLRDRLKKDVQFDYSMAKKGARAPEGVRDERRGPFR